MNFSVRFPFYRYLYQKNVGLAGRHPAPAAFIRHRHRCGRKNARAAANLPQSGIPPAASIRHFEAITKESENTERQRRSADLPAGIQIRADVVEQPTLYRHIPGRHVHQQGHRGDEIPHPVGDTYAGLGRQKRLPGQPVHGAVARRTDRPHPSSGSRTRILHDYSRFTILTIDTFFPAHSAGFHPGVGTRSELQRRNRNRLGTSKSADALVEQIRIDEELQRWLTAFVQERIEDGKRWDVREGILALGNEIFKGEQPRNPLGGAFQGRTGPDRRQGDGEGQGREKGVSGIGRSGHEPHEYRLASRRPTSPARAAASRATSRPQPPERSKHPQLPCAR